MIAFRAGLQSSPLEGPIRPAKERAMSSDDDRTRFFRSAADLCEKLSDLWKAEIDWWIYRTAEKDQIFWRGLSSGEP